MSAEHKYTENSIVSETNINYEEAIRGATPSLQTRGPAPLPLFLRQYSGLYVL